MKVSVYEQFDEKKIKTVTHHFVICGVKSKSNWKFVWTNWWKNETVTQDFVICGVKSL